jgi:streptogramin lyase
MRPRTNCSKSALALTCSALALSACGSGGRGSQASENPSPSSGVKAQLGGTPIGLLAYGGQLWVANARTDRLVRVQPDTGHVTAQVRVGATPLRMIAFQGAIWSTDFGGGTVSKVSPSTLRRVATVHVGPQPEGIVAVGSQLWVVSQQGGYLARVVPEGHEKRVLVGHQPRQATAAGSFVWVSVFGDNSVVEVDPRAGRVLARVRACGGPQGLAESAGQLWVGCTTDGELVDIDVRSHKVVRTLPYDAADGVVRAGSYLRVTSDNGPSTGLLNPGSGHLTDNVKLSDGFIDDANADAAVLGRHTWVSSPDEGVVYRTPGP